MSICVCVEVSPIWWHLSVLFNILRAIRCSLFFPLQLYCMLLTQHSTFFSLSYTNVLWPNGTVYRCSFMAPNSVIKCTSCMTVRSIFYFLCEGPLSLYFILFFSQERKKKTGVKPLITSALLIMVWDGSFHSTFSCLVQHSTSFSHTPDVVRILI